MTQIHARHLCRVTSTLLAREFKAGLTMIGLARKYGLTRRQVEEWIRSVARVRR